MASSKVMATSSSTTSTSTISDLPSSSSSLNYFHLNHHNFVNPVHNHLLNHSPMIPDLHNSPAINVDGLFSNDDDTTDNNGNLLEGDITVIDAAGAISAVDCGGDGSTIRRKTAEDVWREIVGGGGDRKECKVEAADELMTLEDFLARATAEDGGEEDEEEGDVKAEAAAAVTVTVVEGGMYHHHQNHHNQGMVQVQGAVYPPMVGMAGEGGGGRRKRSRGNGGVMTEPLDKAAQQRQKRMIKNRESAARSRERKQAYQVELEALAAKLEEENEQLLREKAARRKQRYKQLMEKIIPVVEKRKPRRTLRRVHSMQW